MKQFILSLAFLLSSCPFISLAQKTAIVDLDSIIQHLPDTRIAQAKLDSSVSFLQQFMEQLQDSIETVMLKYPDTKGPVSLEQKQLRAETLAQCNERVMHFQQDARAGLLEYRTKLFTPIVDKAKKLCEMYAKANAYKVVITKKEKDLTVLYGPVPVTDITPNLIAKINEVIKKK
jgi:Skp family chaperone for outer membrane proteins